MSQRPHDEGSQVSLSLLLSGCVLLQRGEAWNSASTAHF